MDFASVHNVKPHGGDKDEPVKLATVLCEASQFYSNQICDYEVLSPDEIVHYVGEFVQEINGIVELTATITRMLLSHCKWDKEVILEKWFENPDKLYKEARVINPAGVISTTSQADNKECGICYAELSPSMSAESACGHKFCTSCWSEYLKVKIMDEGVGNSIACAASDCDVVIDDDRVIQLVGDEKAKIRYQHLITNSFVQRNKLLRWCPARGCSFAIKADHVALKPICCYCKCGHEFCFGCGKEYHAPVTCDVLKQFEALEANLMAPQQNIAVDAETNVFSYPIFGFDPKIKTCPNPNCRIKIQKVYGCSVVKCKNCGSVFCWECLNRYTSKSKAYSHMCQALANTVDQKPVENVAELASNVPASSTNALNDDDTNNVDHEPAIKMREVTSIVPPPWNQLPKDDDTNMLTNVAGGTTWLTFGYQEDATSNYEGPSSSRQNYSRIARRAGRNVENVRKLMPFNIQYDVAVDKLAKALKLFANNEKFLRESREVPRDILAEFELASLELVRSCRTLKYCAIFAIYAINTTESTLHQSDVNNLDAAVDKLSEYIANISSSFCFDTNDSIRKLVQPACANCQRRRHVLLDYVNEGFDNEWWKFKTEP